MVFKKRESFASHGSVIYEVVSPIVELTAKDHFSAVAEGVRGFSNIFSSLGSMLKQ
jgi:hypothetical protein